MGRPVPHRDAELIARCRAGDEGAFDELAKAHAGDLFVLAMSLVGNRDDAQDVTQDVLIALHKQIGRVRDPRALPAWLSRVCVRHCRALMRRRRRDTPLLDPQFVPNPEKGPEESVVSGEMGMAVRQALLRLPRRQREALVLRYFWGHSTQEVAQALGCAPATARVHLSRAVARLRDALSRKARSDG